MSEVLSPTFITSITGLITALTVLIKLFLVDRKVGEAKETAKDTNQVVRNNQEAIGQVAQNTNGTIAEVMRQVAELRAQIGAQEDSGHLLRQKEGD